MKNKIAVLILLTVLTIFCGCSSESAAQKFLENMGNTVSGYKPERFITGVISDEQLPDLYTKIENSESDIQVFAFLDNSGKINYRTYAIGDDGKGYFLKVQHTDGTNRYIRTDEIASYSDDCSIAATVYEELEYDGDVIYDNCRMYLLPDTVSMYCNYEISIDPDQSSYETDPDWTYIKHCSVGDMTGFFVCSFNGKIKPGTMPLQIT